MRTPRAAIAAARHEVSRADLDVRTEIGDVFKVIRIEPDETIQPIARSS
jgi:hypothetical protein